MLKEALEEEGGHVFGAALLGAVASGEGEEGLAGLGDGGEEDAEFCELSRPTPVLEGVEVAFGGTGAGAATAAAGQSALPSDVSVMVSCWGRPRHAPTCAA